jgi:hypothetical protein
MFDDIFERLSEEAMSLRIAEKFFSLVETSLLRDSKPAFNVSAVKEHLKNLNPRSGADDGKRQATIEALRDEFDRWRTHLAVTDDSIETFHLRRYCDASLATLNDKIFLSLARFYRSIELNRNTQSKFDLMMTRAFAREMRKHRHAHFDREDVTEKIRELYADWSENSVGVDGPDEQIQDAEIRFNAFIAEAHSLSEFDGLIESDIFERLREFKRDLGDLYFAPECVAAAVECNFTVGKTFDSLMTVLNSSLNQRLGEKVDFAGALIDGSLEGQSSLVDLLSGMTGEDTSALAVEGNSDIALLRSFLQRATAVQVAASVEEFESELETEEPAADEVEKDVNSIKKRLSAELATISQPQPDVYVLRNYMARSETLDSLDLNDFLFDENGAPDVLCRRALAAILCLEEFKDNDLKAGKTLEQEITNEIVTLLHFAEAVGAELERTLKGAGRDSHNRLLVVTNNLLSSRLQVERAVVRFTAPVAEPEPEPILEEKPSEPIEITRAPLREANRWLMMMTVLTVLVCGSILLFSGSSSGVAAPVATDVEEVNISRLPSPDHLDQAFRKDNTLFVTAKVTWRELKEEQRRNDLQKMVELEMKKQLYNVTVIGPDGTPMRSLSAKGIVLIDAAAEAETEPEPTK